MQGVVKINWYAVDREIFVAKIFRLLIFRIVLFLSLYDCLTKIGVGRIFIYAGKYNCNYTVNVYLFIKENISPV